jgi:hypothetical protein
MRVIRPASGLPSKRTRAFVKLFHVRVNGLYKFNKYKNKKYGFLSGGKLLFGVKWFFKKILHAINSGPLFCMDFVLLSFHYSKAPFKELLLGKTLYGHFAYFLSTIFNHPGMWLLSDYIFEEDNFVGQFTLLRFIFLGSLICQIFNRGGERSTFIKSSGCKGVKSRSYKKSKLIGVNMPSGQLKLFKKNTICSFSFITNLYLHKCVDGAWGFSMRPKKKISVRGVAKNPVDHPNGGRTKAKQTELSP